MLQVTGAIVGDQPKSVSAVKPKREGGHARAKKRRGGHNVIWKRITKAYDEELKKLGADPAMVSPVTRWILFGHLTRFQGMAARRYQRIMLSFEHYCIPPMQRTARSAAIEPMRPGDDQEVARHEFNGTLHDYEEQARYAKRQYKRLMKVLDRYKDPVSGRNYVKDALDDLILKDTELPSELRPQVAAVLSVVAKEFGIGGTKSGKVQ